jgi:hypothetical protein
MPVITISRQHGARASLVVSGLAERKGLKVAYKRDVEENLRNVVGSFLAAKYTSEKEPTFLDTIMYNMELWRGLLCETVLSIAKSGNVIIYGRGGWVILRDIPGVAHILIVGDRKKRIQHISRKNEITPHEAEEIIAEIEKKREGFYSHHFGETWTDPGNFDLILNPLSLGIDRCADIISSLTDMPSFADDFRKKGKKAMEERYVEVSAGNRITLAANLDHNFFDVSVRRGKTIKITFYDVPAAVREKAVSAVANFHKGFKVLQTKASLPKGTKGDGLAV